MITLFSGSKVKVEIKSEDEEEEILDDDYDENNDEINFGGKFENQCLSEALKRVDGSEIEVSSIDYSFEKTPFRESWFQTYSRQDQGDEILFYYEHKSFPLPYEMPMNTFYGKPPKKSGASGTATPIEEDTNDASSATPSHEPPHTPLVATPTRSTRAGKQNKNSTKKNLKQHSSGSVDSQNGSFYDKIDKKRAAALKSEISRKSPRGHASTKSLQGNSYRFFSTFFIFFLYFDRIFELAPIFFCM